MLDQVSKCIQDRRSIRAYLSDDIPQTNIMQILSAGIAAPSAGNAQCWFYYIVRNKKYRVRLAVVALGQNFVAQAPVVIAVCADLERAAESYRNRGQTLYCLQDTAAAIQNMLLTIHAMGLGSCYHQSHVVRTCWRTVLMPAFSPSGSGSAQSARGSFPPESTISRCTNSVE